MKDNEPKSPKPQRPEAGAARSTNEIPVSQAKPREVQSVKMPTLELPKGGGAIRGIGEKVSTNLAMGTSGVSVPIKTSPGRGGFGPELALTYSSGAGNGLFGLGWALGVPSVSRRTDQRIPTYDAEDTFLWGDEEELVPKLADGEPVTYEGTVDGEAAQCERFLPRVEGSYARIERVTEADGNVFWRVTTRDNLTHIYGRTAECRIADPENGAKVFRWLLERSYDDRGNVLEYEYKQEDLDGVDPLAICERNRGTESLGQRHLKRIYYGNRTPYLLEHAPRAHADVEADPEREDFLFVVLFDYGEHAAASGLFDDRPTDPPTTPPPEWSHREDAFSTHRQGFELRTRRLCKRVLMFHRIVGETPDLVAVTCFDYDETPAATMLKRAWIEGHGDTFTVGLPVLASPPMDFGYTSADLDESSGTVSPDDLAGMPEGLDGERYRWVDLDLEGLPGVLTEQGGQWFYKRNEGEGHFGAPARLPTLPNLADLGGGGCSLQDLGGDGGLQLVVQQPGVAGYFERTAEEDWEPFRAFRTRLTVPLSDPHVRLLDLDGDGRADVLVSEEEVFCWFPSEGREGHGPGRVLRKATDEEKGPRVLFADGEQSIFLADMSGDGLTDLVRIRNGSVCYWPNLGHGRFGAKVAMTQAPRFDHPDRFRPDRLHLADVDGSGTADLLYVGARDTRLWRNHAGNGFGDAETVHLLPGVGAATEVTVADFLGRGTMCLVASTPVAGTARAQVRYVDLFSGQKPRLLRTVRNNLGMETEVRYAQSTRFYLEDRAAGKPWVTKLPFPVQVVERVITRDLVTGSEHVASYRYHHGHYDRAEKEFRGFGMVEQTDAESFAPFVGTGHFVEGDADDVLVVPPVVTRTWTHTGAWFEGRRIEEHFREREYFLGDETEYRGAEHVLAARLPMTVLPAGLAPSAQREACRALRGRTLRVEVTVNDGLPVSKVPYQITETNFAVTMVQAEGAHAVVRVDPGETITFQTERSAFDPRIAHSLTLAVDDYGTVTRSIAVVYPRRVTFSPPTGLSTDAANAVIAAQARLYLTYSETDVAHADGDTGPYRLAVPVGSRSYEVLWRTAEPDPEADPPTAPPTDRFFRVSDFATVPTLTGDADLVAPTEPVPVGEEDAPLFQRRLLESSRQLYWNDDYDGPLALGSFGARALLFETRVAAFTDDLLDAVYGERIPATGTARTELLAGEGGYVFEDGFWWARSGCARPSEDDFYQPTRFYDAWNADLVVESDEEEPEDVYWSEVTYDEHALFVIKAEDVFDNLTEATIDYHRLGPTEVKDANGNRSRVRCDALGRVVETYALGKETADEGDRWPEGAITALPGAIFEYSLAEEEPETFVATAPVWARAKVRTTHRGEAFEEAVVYSDGFGRELLTKTKVEPATEEGPDRWIGSGRTVFNNKGNAVKKYEPYFSDSEDYDPEEVLARTRDDVDPGLEGVTPVLRYDALGRLIETRLPDGTRTRVAFSAWHEVHWDANDTVVGSRWANDRDSLDSDDPDYRALTLSLEHRDTPTRVYLDTLARPVVSVADNTNYGETVTLYATRVTLDVQGRQSEVIDALERRVQWQGFDLLGRPLWTRMMDSSGGPVTEEDEEEPVTMPDALETAVARMLPDVAGQTLLKWTERGYEFYDTYDVARRLTTVRVRRRDDPTQHPDPTLITPADETGEVTEYLRYGESHPTAAAANLRGRLWCLYDGAGRLEHTGHDLDGNLLATNRRLPKAHRGTVDWTATAEASTDGERATAENVKLLAEVFETSSIYDALGRVREVVPPHSTGGGAPSTHAQLVRQTYNQAGLLKTVEAQFGTDESAFTTIVAGVTYNARRQREQVFHGNGIVTTYTYDRRTFRLVRLVATQGTGSEAVLAQDMRYTYDATGNVVEFHDVAGEEEDRLVEAITSGAESKYTYDSLDRLVKATGREHPAILGGTGTELEPDGGRLRHLNDLTGLLDYTEEYAYDAVGNLLLVDHQVPDDSSRTWKRDYRYAEDSNRLLSTRLPDDPSEGVVPTGSLTIRYDYDEHGNMVEMPHLPIMAWDAYEQLSATRNAGGAGRVECHFQYDAHGQRVRKAVEHYTGGACTIVEERIYLGGSEVYRWHTGDGVEDDVTKEVQTLHLMDGEQRIAMHDARTVQLGTGSVIETPAVGSRVTRTRYQHGNHLGSACLETDEDGELVSYEEYHPHGTTAMVYSRDGDGDEPKRYRFTGMERDETGLQYHSARYYTPWLGRWASPDPAGTSDGACAYGYCRGRPCGAIDTSGNITDDELNGPADRRTEPPRPEEPRDTSVAEQVVAGDFYEGRTTLGGVIANIGVGLVPYVGQAADARDTVSALSRFHSNPSWGNAGGVGLAIVGWLPLFGDAVRGGVRLGRHALMEGGQEALQRAGREGVREVAAAGGRSQVRQLGSPHGWRPELPRGGRGPSSPLIGADGLAITQRPGAYGVEISRRPTPREMLDLQRDLGRDLGGVEVSVLYRPGTGRNGGGGTYRLYSGTFDEVAHLGLQRGDIWVAHTHPTPGPRGSRHSQIGAGDEDRDMLDMRTAAQASLRGGPGQPGVQRSSVVHVEGVSPERTSSRFGRGIRRPTRQQR